MITLVVEGWQDEENQVCLDFIGGFDFSKVLWTLCKHDLVILNSKVVIPVNLFHGSCQYCGKFREYELSYESLRSPFEDMATPPQTKMKPKECDLM